MLLGYIWLLGTFVNSSCDIKINVNIVQNCRRNLAVRGLRENFRVFVTEWIKAQKISGSLVIKNIFKRVATSFFASVVNNGDFYSLIKVTLN